MLLFVLSVGGPVCGLAADRNYEINFYGGNGGSVSGTVGGPYTAGSGTVPFPNVTPKDNYYFKGYIESGKDPRNYEQYPGSAPTDRDRDYVAVYGIRGTEVRYTVQYLLYNTTTKLAPDGVFYALLLLHCDPGRNHDDHHDHGRRRRRRSGCRSRCSRCRCQCGEPGRSCSRSRRWCKCRRKCRCKRQ